MLAKEKQQRLLVRLFAVCLALFLWVQIPLDCWFWDFLCPLAEVF